MKAFNASVDSLGLGIGRIKVLRGGSKACALADTLTIEVNEILGF